MNKLATILLCANFITVLFPQPSYIHPDEFFQSSEIVAGDVLKVQHFRVWEFNGTSAVRTIVFPYMVMSPSLYFLNWINATGVMEFQLSAVKVVMATRLPIAFLSLLGYIATGRLASCFHVNEYISTVLYCSSYVTWTYYTRTFSNSVESVLLAIVLLLVLTFSGKGESISDLENLEKDKQELKVTKELDENKTGKNSYENAVSKTQKDPKLLQPLEDNVTTLTDPHSNPKKGKNIEEISGNKKESAKKVKHSGNKKVDKGTKEMSKESIKDRTQEKEFKISNAEISHLRACICKLVSFLLGAVVTAGFFNRPTFLVFAAVPYLYWLWSATKADCHGRWSGAPMIVLIIFSTTGAVFTFITFVLLDTIYFNPVFLVNVARMVDSSIKEPLSLPSIQTNLEILASSLVVTPWNFIKYNSNSDNLAHHGLHPRFTHFLINLPLLLGPLFIPFVIVCALSMFRLLRKSKESNKIAWLSFMALVPVIGLSVFPHQEPRFLIPALPVFVVMGAKIVSTLTPGKLSFFALWTAFNILFTFIYGYIHQAALIPALSIYQQKLTSSQSNTNHHAIFYYTYSPPRHLLLLHPDNSQVHIHELAGAPIETFIQTFKQIRSTCQRSENKCKIFMFVPSTVTPWVMDHLGSFKVSTTSICPHLSMEAPPRLRAWWGKRLSFDELIMDFCLNILTVT